MKDIAWSPDKVTLMFSSRIAWLGEAYLEGRRRLPEIFFGETPFQKVERAEDRIHVDLPEWVEFLRLAAGALRDNRQMRNRLAAQIDAHLSRYQHKVTEGEESWERGYSLSFSCLQKQFESLSAVTAFSALNFLIPKTYYQCTLYDLGICEHDANDDVFLVSQVTPHRIQLRQARLQLGLQMHREGGIPEESLREYRKGIAPYEAFESWCLDDARLADARILERDIREMAKYSTPQEMQSELIAIEANRSRVMERRHQALREVACKATYRCSPNQVRDLVEQFAFLSVLATEEEVRHMIQARQLVLLGRIVRHLSLNPARATIAEILFAAERQWGP